MSRLQKLLCTELFIYGFAATCAGIIGAVDQPALAVTRFDQPALAVPPVRPSWLEELSARAARGACVIDTDALNFAQLEAVSAVLVVGERPVDVVFPDHYPQPIQTRPLRCPIIQQGKSSWYGGPRWNGRRTASGQIFDDQEATAAACSSLPLKTDYCVVNTATRKSTVVLVNDRGGFCRMYNRILDVSASVAVTLGFKTQGTAEVAVMEPQCCKDMNAQGRPVSGDI